MVSFETVPAIPPDRAAPIAHGLWCWPALVTGLALILDALCPLGSEAGVHSPLWLDLAALACLAWALLGRSRARHSEWRTPLDGRIVAGLAVAVLHSVRLGGAAGSLQGLRHIVVVGACYYALSARLRREPRAPDAVWPVFAFAVLALSAYVLGQATHGTNALRAACNIVDVRWASQFGLAKTLLLVTLLCVGRACEPGARGLWRATALTGVLASVLSLVVGGAGLGVASLASLDEPFYFGTSIVVFMLLASLSRMSWKLSRERPEEAGRWRAATLLFPAITGFLLFGGTTGGEGLRAITGLAAAAVIATHLAPRPAAVRQGAVRPAEVREARAA